MFDENKQKNTSSKIIQQNISDIDDDIIEDDEEQSSVDQQSELINEIKDQMETLRRLSKSYSKLGTRQFGNNLKKHKYIKGSLRQNSRTFKDSEVDFKSSSSIRSVSIGQPLGTETVQTEPS